MNCILIITSDAADAKALKDVLGKAIVGGVFTTEWETTLSDGIKRLSTGGIDAVLVDLFLADSQGIDTFDTLFAAFPYTPIMILKTVVDEMLTAEAIQRGAQGYLTKVHFGSSLVALSLQAMIQRKVVEKTYFIEKKRTDIMLNSISDAVIGTDMFGNVDYLNIAAESMTGWSRDDARGNSIATVMNIVNSTTREIEHNPVEWVLREDKPMGLTAGTILIRSDGHESAIENSAEPIHDRDGKLSGAVIVFHDITVAQRMTLQMAYLAQYDFLTGLPNRVLLKDRINKAIDFAKQSKTTLAVLFLDLDNFKHINDSLGHGTGDALLKSVARRLQECVRRTYTVSRQGGDEFVILVTEDTFAAQDAAMTADRIITALASPHSIGKEELHVTPSIGISVYPADANDAETLIKNADTAMYHAKENGRNNYQFFKNDMNTRAVERQVIETHLRKAINRQEFVLHYQPQIHLKTGTITGVEALLRWIHPKWGVITPDRFIQTAEESGLIVSIGRWVLREACTQTKRWEDAGLKPGSVAVNVSAVEFRHKGFVDGVRIILKETGLAPDSLQLEMTESVLMSDAEASTVILQQLKDMGIHLVVDDFGTGYSSLSYLKQFPIDVLKIDQSFIQDIGIDGNGTIVTAVINMGNSLRQRVIAEGVEKQAQLTFLKDHHCEEGQGYFFSQPLDDDQYAGLLSTGISEQVCNIGI